MSGTTVVWDWDTDPTSRQISDVLPTVKMSSGDSIVDYGDNNYDFFVCVEHWTATANAYAIFNSYRGIVVAHGRGTNCPTQTTAAEEDPANPYYLPNK